MAKQVSKSDYVDASGAIRCVDERKDKSGELLGVQLPGGVLHIADLLQVALLKANQEYGHSQILEMVDEVLASDEAKKYDVRAGVHIDDEHGHIDAVDELASRVAGCGYDGVRSQVFERMELELDYVAGTDISEARKRGWNVQVLTGEHHPEATAAINSMDGKTLQTQALHKDGRVQSFNYDWWVVRVLKPAMVRVLEAHEFGIAASLLSESAEEWGKQLYSHTLDILTKGRLNSGTLIEIN